MFFVKSLRQTSWGELQGSRGEPEARPERLRDLKTARGESALAVLPLSGPPGLAPGPPLDPGPPPASLS